MEEVRVFNRAIPDADFSTHKEVIKKKEHTFPFQSDYRALFSCIVLSLSELPNGNAFLLASCVSHKVWVKNPAQP